MEAAVKGRLESHLFPEPAGLEKIDVCNRFFHQFVYPLDGQSKIQDVFADEELMFIRRYEVSRIGLDKLGFFRDEIDERPQHLVRQSCQSEVGTLHPLVRLLVLGILALALVTKKSEYIERGCHSCDRCRCVVRLIYGKDE